MWLIHDNTVGTCIGQVTVRWQGSQVTRQSGDSQVTRQSGDKAVRWQANILTRWMLPVAPQPWEEGYVDYFLSKGTLSYHFLNTMNFSCLNISQLEVVVKCVTPVFCQWKLNSTQNAEILRLPGLFVGVADLQEKTSQKVPYKGFALPVSWHVRSGLLLPRVTRSAVTLHNTKYCNTKFCYLV